MRVPKERALTILALAFAFAGACVFLLRVHIGLSLLEFGDEAEKYVAAQLIVAGKKLYLDIFAHHGPVPYMLSHWYAVLYSDSDFTYARVIVIALALMAAFSIFVSPAFRSWSARGWATGSFLLIISSIWVLSSIQMLLYQQITAFLALVAVFQLLLPTMMGRVPTRVGSCAAGAAVTLACFASYAVGPAVVCLVLGAFVPLIKNHAVLKRVLLPFLLGVLISLAVVLIWMFSYGDLTGYFAYHFYFNQVIYSKFIDVSLGDMKDLFAFELKPISYTQDLSVVWLLAAAALLSVVVMRSSTQLKAFKLLAVLLTIFFALLLNPRGKYGFHGTAFVLANCALFIAAIALLIDRAFVSWNLRRQAFWVAVLAISVIGMEAVSRISISSPHGILKRDLASNRVTLRPPPGGELGFVRSITEKNGDLLALVFNPSVYLLTDRRPASGHYYYLPWQAAYKRNPILGHNIDICADIANNSPAVIWFHDWKVWDQYAIADYEPCVPQLLSERYAPLQPDGHWYLRKDIHAQERWVPPTAATVLQPSQPLAPGNNIEVIFPDRHVSEGAALQRVGVLFGTYANTGRGKAELRLEGPGADAYHAEFDLAQLDDNQYRFFDVNGGHFDRGTIEAVSGGGVSSWENHSQAEAVLTCVALDYVDGTRRVTAGCPFH
ncbi:hypothetical protein SAMN05216421_0739 [Halopseudomonas xinjiangensis]|uniref:4-amino-4-deoxy-L-arabinose transferase n=1 Tax=Halopseudomonas xinjiangensis TaxID=487184 RepID=A0A1H1NPZ5_9GAMM|nr:hypothetical protein [Halopseudomonas xinjiangensis]SDS01086.1 hypothetical protein SAMN05216421_0739 [Halopseudomonas xinjiangensis]